MPRHVPRICGCGFKVAHGELCPCQRKRKAEADKRRPGARERGYSPEWEKEAKAFLRAHPKCVRCGAPSAVVDHVKPHRGDMKVFWSRSNWQPLCTACHARWKQARERRASA